MGAQNEKGEKIEVDRSAMALELRTASAGGTLRFDVEGGSSVTFFLRYDTRAVADRAIAVGKRGTAPDRNPVSFRRAKPEEGGDRKHDHPKGDHHHHRHTHPHVASDHHHHPHEHPHAITHGHHPH